jgi:chemotaxis protein CheD
MKVSTFNGMQRFTIDPGEYHVAQGNVIISTLLGSCVSACLWDPVKRIIGMNHFLLANQRYSREMPVIQSEAGRYGIHAMELLINAMFKAGASKSNLQAKAFGGGNVLANLYKQESFFAVGDVNSRFILEFLKNERIPLVASDLGGEHGRVINFVAADFSVYLKRIERTDSEKQVVAAEHRYYDKELARQKQDEVQKPTEVAYW